VNAAPAGAFSATLFFQFCHYRFHPRHLSSSRPSATGDVFELALIAKR